MKKINFKLILLAPLFILSCTSSKINSSWKAENSQTRSYHNIMVWAILPEKDSTIRKQMETHLVNDLIGKGYHAISSLDVYSSQAYKKLSSKEIVDEFKTTGVDAVMTVVLLNKEKEEKYYPGGVLNQPVYNDPGNNSGTLDRYYSTVYEKILTPGYYISTTNYFWESKFFEVDKDKLIYSVRSGSFDPASTERLAHEHGLLIMKDMMKKKLILDKMPKED
ncbi:MAG TPA: hypothetical protein VHL77_00735 [Ferruginibacter sp.]|nr:hypothetical protein [Ferruginibacter sp.]